MDVAGIVYVLLGLLGEYGLVAADKVSEKIYQDFESPITPICFRLLNSTTAIGCGSSRYGNVGVIHYVATDDDLVFLTSGDAPHAPYVAVLEPKYFTKKNIISFISGDVVNGVIVLNTAESLSRLYSDSTYTFSPDQHCPNDGYGVSWNDDQYDTDCAAPWNEDANSGLLDLHIPFPIFLMANVTEVDALINDCYKRFNVAEGDKELEWPLCAGQLGSFMTAANSSVTCVRRSNLINNLQSVQYCDPLGSSNVYASHLPTSKAETFDSRKYIIVASRLDTAAIFDMVSPGIDSAITGFITNLATAYVVGQVARTQNISEQRTRDIIFLFLHGEAYDYIGSSKVIYDMGEGHFPFPLTSDKESDQPHLISLEDISLFIELNQLASVTSKLTAFTSTNAKAAYLSLTTAASGSLTLEQVPDISGNSIPPLSAQRFHSQLHSIPLLLLTGYKDKFSRFYNSHFDRLEALSINFTDRPEPYNSSSTPDLPLAQGLARVAQALALALYDLAYDIKDIQYPQQDFDDLVKEVAELLYCFGYTSRCELFQQVMSPDAADKWFSQEGFLPPFPTYITANKNNQLPPIVASLLSQYLALDKTPAGVPTADIQEADCKGDGNVTYRWMRGERGNGTCVVSSVWLLPAMSPAFLLPHYDLASNPAHYSTWTESRWSPTTIRIFLRPDPAYEAAILVVGVVVLVFSFVVSYLAHKRSHLLLPPPPAG